MKLSVVLVAVVMMSVLDVTSSFLSKDKRGGVAASLHGNFHRSLHQPLFARAQGEDKRDWKDGVDKHKKSNPPTQKRFVDVLSTSWDSTDSWGQSDPWGNAWGDPWGDSSYNYYYYTWPKLRKRGVKTNQADKSIASTKRDEQTQKDDKVIKRGAKMDSKDAPKDRFDRDYIGALFGTGSHNSPSKKPSWSNHFDIQSSMNNNGDSYDEYLLEECSYCCYDYDDNCYYNCYDLYYDLDCDYNGEDYEYYDDDKKVSKRGDFSKSALPSIEQKAEITDKYLDKKTDKHLTRTVITDKILDKKTDKHLTDSQKDLVDRSYPFLNGNSWQQNQQPNQGWESYNHGYYNSYGYNDDQIEECSYCCYDYDDYCYDNCYNIYDDLDCDYYDDDYYYGKNKKLSKRSATSKSTDIKDFKTKDKKTSQPLNAFTTYQQPAYYYYYYQQQPNYQVQTSPYYYVITYPKRMMQRAFAAHKARRHLDDKDKKSVKDVAKVTDKKSKQDKADLDKKESQLMSALKRYMADDYKKK